MIKKLLVSALMVAPLYNGVVYANTKTVVDDSVITASVKAKIISEKAVSAPNIKVETDHGLVKLKGIVKTTEEADKVIEIATSTEGVIGVETSNLTIEESEHPVKDSLITSKVKALFVKEKIFGDKPISVSTVHVETKDGVVYLSGKVKNKAQMDTISHLANSIEGVKDVKSSVEIQ